MYAVNGSGESPPHKTSLQICVVSSRIDASGLGQPRTLLGSEFGLHLTGNGGDNIILKREDIAGIPIVTIGPKNLSGLRFHQLRINLNSVACPQDRCGHESLDSQFARNVAQWLLAAFEHICRWLGNDFLQTYPRQVRN